jgi:hypothetical protein
MSVATGTIFTYGPLGKDGNPILTSGSFLQAQINVGLLGVAIAITGIYVGTMVVEVSIDHAMTWTTIDTITSQQITKVYTFTQFQPFLITDLRVRGLAWTSGTANIDIEPWSVPLSAPIAGSNNTLEVQHAPDVFHSVGVNAAGNSLVWTPASGKRFRLLHFFIQPSQDAILTGGADLNVDLRDNNVSIGVTVAFFLLKAMGTAPYAPIEMDLGPIGYLSSAPNNVLNVNLSAAIPASAQCRVVVMGTEE